MKIKIDGEVYTVSKVHAAREDCPAMIEVEGSSLEFYVDPDSETAGARVAEYYREMRANDKEEFKCIIGTERLLQWACDESDEFGISSFEEFCERVAEVPGEHWGGWDGSELDCEIVFDADEHTDEDTTDNERDRIQETWNVEDSELYSKLGFAPTVAYRHN